MSSSNISSLDSLDNLSQVLNLNFISLYSSSIIKLNANDGNCKHWCQHGVETTNPRQTSNETF